MRKIIIAILLLTAFTAQSQTKWRQIERSLTKWNVPAAYDSIPGQTGYAGKWIDLATLLDTLGLDTIGGSGISGSGVADRVTIWSGVNSLTSNANFTFTGGNTVNIIGRMIMQATATAGNWNAFINGGNTTLTGTKNIAIGSNQTLSSLTTGNSNLAFGTLAGYKTTTGSENVFLGYLTGSENTTGNSNMYIGAGSGYLNNGDYNTFIGSNTGRNCLTTLGNIFLGYNTGYNATNNYNIGIGYYNSFNTSNSGTENVIIGTQASQNGGGNYNVKIGTQSGYANTGSNNVFIGQESGFSTSSKGGNIFIGYEAGRNEDIDNSLIISNSASTSNGIYGDYDNSKFGVNIAPASAARTWDINGELRIRDVTTDNPTKLLGADADGDVSGVTLGSGLTLSGTTLNVSSFVDSTVVSAGYGLTVNESPANTFTVKADTSEVATQYDLTLKQDKLVSGNNIKTVNSNSLLGSGNVSVGTVTSIATSAPISGGTITGSGIIGLNYDPIYMGLDGLSRLYPLYNVATWNANELRGKPIIVPFSPTTGQVLTWNGTHWTAATPTAATDLFFTGSASPYTLNSSNGTDVQISAGTGINLSMVNNNLTIGSTLSTPATWFDWGTYIENWSNTGAFGSGKNVGISTPSAGPTRDFDVNGDVRFRGAIYNSTNSAGTSGQVLTSGGTGAWTWSTPVDNSETNEAQTLTLGSNQTVALSSVSGVGGGSFEIPQYRHASMWKTSNLTGQTLDGTPRKLTFDSQVSAPGLVANTTNGLITPQVGGVYRIDYSGSYSVNATYDQSVRFELYKGAVTFGYQSECRTMVYDGSVNNMAHFSKTIVTTLNANEPISLYYTKTVGTNATITFYNLNFSIQRIN